MEELTQEQKDQQAAEQLQAKKAKAGDEHFVYEGKVYVPKIPQVFIPGLGTRTALEICTDENAQAYLVKENCIGSVISEVE